MKKKITDFMGSSWGQRITILVLIMIVMAIFQPRFFRVTNMYSILLSISLYGIMACGMLTVILVGGIDLCQGSTAAMAGVLMTSYTMNHGYTPEAFFTGVAIGLGSAILLGLFHGIECAYFKIPAFVLTFATQYAIVGLVNVYTNATYLQPLTDGIYYFVGNGKVFGIPMPIVIFVIYAIIISFVLSYTKFGRRIYAVGGNPEAAELDGVNSKVHIISAYVLSSISAAIGGMVLCCMNQQAAYSTASGYEGKVLTAMVVGGINLAGGEGKVSGAVFGALLVGVINNILILLNVPATYQNFVQGVIIICAVALNVYTRRKSLGLTGVSKHIFDKPEEKKDAKKHPVS
ncbi:MAG: ABC transporter permease [Oscillospiraceae bacterium]|nr:ABC transporter permease [Oscillospiraceae bacterium]